MINQLLFTKPKEFQKTRPSRRPSAKAVLRQIQRLRGPPLEAEEEKLDRPVRVKKSSQGRKPVSRRAEDRLEPTARVRRSSQRADAEEIEPDQARLDPPVRVIASSQEDEAVVREFSRAKRDIARGKRPVEPSKPNDGSQSEKEEIAVAKKKSSKPKQVLSKEEYLKVLLARNFAGTRYPHRETCKKLGIARDVEYLYEMSGLSTFMQYQLEAYQEETCHFLSSLEVHFYQDEPEYESDGGPGFITFTCRGMLYSLTIKELDVLYGFESRTGTMQEVEAKELQALWSTIGNDKPYSSARTKSSQIRSPVVRYFHKAIASTLFARTVTGNLNESELQLLDEALKDVLGCSRDGRELLGDRADTSLTFVLLSQLLCYKDWALRMHRMNSDGELSIGGVITPILVACDVELTSPPCAPRWIDIEHLTRAHFLDASPPPNKYLYRFTHPIAGEAKLRLPCPEITSIRTGANIDFIPPLEALYNPHQESPQPEESDDSEGEDDEDTSARFGFEEYHAQRQSPALKEAHRRIGLLQKWNKLQGKTIAALKGTVKELKDQMRDMRHQFHEFQTKLSGSTSKKVVLPKRVLSKSGSLREEPRTRTAIEPPRASSFEPRQPFKHYSRQKKRRPAGEPTDSTDRLDRPIESVTESAHHAAYTRESMEDSISSFFSNP